MRAVYDDGTGRSLIWIIHQGFGRPWDVMSSQIGVACSTDKSGWEFRCRFASAARLDNSVAYELSS
jgi:hypothetical protein